MTENKRFTSDIHRIFDNDEEIACADTMDDAETIVDLLNEKEEEIQELKQTIDTIAKDYEESHGMDIRNAEWFTAW